jgi:hypothetical protein
VFCSRRVLAADIGEEGAEFLPSPRTFDGDGGAEEEVPSARCMVPVFSSISLWASRSGSSSKVASAEAELVESREAGVAPAGALVPPPFSIANMIASWFLAVGVLGCCRWVGFLVLSLGGNVRLGGLLYS